MATCCSRPASTVDLETATCSSQMVVFTPADAMLWMFRGLNPSSGSVVFEVDDIFL